MAILHYLRDHPQAKDSAKGIAQWWVEEKQEIVAKALALLVKEGVVEKRGHLYQIAPLKREMNDSRKKTLRRLRPRKSTES